MSSQHYPCAQRNSYRWRCHRCGRLLGIVDGGFVHIRHKRLDLTIHGMVAALCPKCAELNQINLVCGTQHKEGVCHVSGIN